MPSRSPPFPFFSYGNNKGCPHVLVRYGGKKTETRGWCGFRGIGYKNKLTVRILSVSLFIAVTVRLSVYESHANLRQVLYFHPAMQWPWNMRKASKIVMTKYSFHKVFVLFSSIFIFSQHLFDYLWQGWRWKRQLSLHSTRKSMACVCLHVASPTGDSVWKQNTK